MGQIILARSFEPINIRTADVIAIFAVKKTDVENSASVY
ncbi:Uncharacterized protein YR821_1572 [Yersinia ruckeri]|uniref:Uncharacterized protein n=1 Tax=Yersinia ruckeri TaxID=29486 RepID=A0A0A8VG99_YERRU|nr:hypothetical protein yruck0001_15860 [Yersinia ruckeri ATCC 29473]QTD76496.1 Uncharacterized protein YR821_1572 [Yersinia ruckeri]CEK27398.1 hypothetical protein CSF007_8220 [Yersinia ruckeri]